MNESAQTLHHPQNMRYVLKTMVYVCIMYFISIKTVYFKEQFWLSGSCIICTRKQLTPNQGVGPIKLFGINLLTLYCKLNHFIAMQHKLFF